MAKQDDIRANPLVEEMAEDTIYNCRSVLAFLAWTKTTESDAPLQGDALAGEFYVLRCVRDALGTLSEALQTAKAPRIAA